MRHLATNHLEKKNICHLYLKPNLPSGLSLFNMICLVTMNGQFCNPRSRLISLWKIFFSFLRGFTGQKVIADFPKKQTEWMITFSRLKKGGFDFRYTRSLEMGLIQGRR